MRWMDILKADDQVIYVLGFGHAYRQLRKLIGKDPGYGKTYLEGEERGYSPDKEGKPALTTTPAVPIGNQRDSPEMKELLIDISIAKKAKNMMDNLRLIPLTGMTSSGDKKERVSKDSHVVSRETIGRKRLSTRSRLGGKLEGPLPEPSKDKEGNYKRQKRPRTVVREMQISTDKRPLYVSGERDERYLEVEELVEEINEQLDGIDSMDIPELKLFLKKGKVKFVGAKKDKKPEV